MPRSADVDAAGEPGEGVELERLRGAAAEGQQVLAAVAGDVAAGPGPVADHHVGQLVVVEVAGHDPDPAAVLRVPGEEVQDRGDLAAPQPGTGEGGDPRGAARAAAGDRLGDPVPVEVADADEH